MTVIAQTQFGNYHVILDSYSEHDDEGYFSRLEIRVLVQELGRWGWLWKCQRVVDCGKQYATGKFGSPQPIRDMANLRFENISIELLKKRKLDLSKIRNDE